MILPVSGKFCWAEFDLAVLIVATGGKTIDSYERALNPDCWRFLLSSVKKTLNRYQYDALDRLSGHGQLTGSECQRFYCDGRLVTEIDGGEQLSIVQHGDQLLAQLQHHNGGTSTLLATDFQQSTLYVIQTGLKQSFAYSPYGHRHIVSGLFSLLGFNGQRPDPETGHYLLGNGYRAFNPVLMRFNSPDNLSPLDKGGFNAYVYCAGDPINRADPTGHIFSTIARMVSRAPKYRIDEKTGALLKSVKKLTRLSEGVVVFQDKYKGGKRLTFQGHGSIAEIGRGDGGLLSPSQLIDLAESRGVSVGKYDSYRVVACYSASRDTRHVSFVEELSKILGRPVKGYKGMIAVTESSLAYPKLAMGETYKGVHYFGIAKRPEKGSLHKPNYQPFTFGGIDRVRSEIRK